MGLINPNSAQDVFNLQIKKGNGLVCHDYEPCNTALSDDAASCEHRLLSYSHRFRL